MTNLLNPHDFDELEASTMNHRETSEHIGDTLNDNPDPGITRMYFQNINGLRWDEEGGKWPYICEVLESIQADIAGFVEVNTNTNDYRVRRKMESICQHQFMQIRLIMSSSSQTTKSTYKPGGTAIVARNEITARIKSHTQG